MAEDALGEALTRLAEALGALDFGLLADDRAAVVSRRDRVRGEVEGHVARLARLDAPLLAVVGGVTGGGKSTLVNTLAGAAVAPTGVRRPTTSTPTLVCHPDDAGWFRGDGVLPGLARREGPAQPARTRRRRKAPPEAEATGGGGARSLHLVERAAVPAGLALLDAPDSDSISAGNRALADALLDAADVWLWVTTQGKYADEDSMALLRRARDRRTAVTIALTHVDADQLQVVVEDFRGKLAAEGLADVELFAVPRSPVSDEQLPEHAVYDLRGWLWGLAAPARRTAVRDQTLQGALDVLATEVEPLLDALDDEHRVYRSLTAAAGERYREAGERFADLLEQGQISMREQVLRRWVDFIGTGRFQRFLQSATGQARQARRRLSAVLVDRRQEPLEQELRVEAADAVGGRVRQVADVAAGATADEWLRAPAGRVLLDGHPDLHRSSPDLPDRVADAVAAWERELVELVTTKGAVRKARTQWASTAINATAASLMLVVFTATGGLTGAEVGIAGAGATAGQLVLERMLGGQNVRWLVAEAKRGLLDRVEGVLDAERARFRQAAAERAPAADDRQRLVDALEQVRRSRR